MGQTFEEIKSGFINKYISDHPLTEREKRAGVNRDNEASYQWSLHMKDVVTNRISENEIQDDCLSLVFDDSRKAISNTGGWVVSREVEGDNPVRVTTEVSMKFVVCLYQGEPAAMTILQAYRNGCREMEWPRQEIAEC